MEPEDEGIDLADRLAIGRSVPAISYGMPLLATSLPDLTASQKPHKDV